MVRLDAADRHEGVASLRERVGDEVLEFADLVATERDAGVAVLALGPDLDIAAERVGQAGQWVDGRRPEHERVAGEVGELHGGSFERW